MRKLIIVFFIIYCLFGITLSMYFGSPNGTNDFIFHYYRANGDIENPEFTQYYSVEKMSSYPETFHILASPFASQGKLGLYLFAVFLIIVIAPLILFHFKGSIAVWVYYSLSLPHMILYNSTYASFMILIYFLLYLFFKRKLWAFIFFGMLAVITHRWGLYFWAIIWIAEVIELLLIKYKIIEKLKPLKHSAGIGVLAQDKIMSFTKLISVFLNHMNFYFFYLARKSKNYFLWILIIFGIIGAIIIDFRVLILSQVCLPIIVAEELKNKKVSKKFYLICIFLMILNFSLYFLETEKFLFFN